MIDDLKIIKDKYGENMMHLCRKLFPTLLEINGLLSRLLLDKFAPSRFLYEDIINSNKIEEFRNYINSLNLIKDEELVETGKTPYELLKESGYNLYECKSESDIQYFKRYYKEDELLCTFAGDRLDTCYVFFAVKDNVDEIKRENFLVPNRQDEYGTSVISIQFSIGNVNALSIKNRYNHKVENPDATFSNNLENIIPGLSKSFEKEYGYNIYQNEKISFELPNYVRAIDGKYYKYNYEIDNIYYCPNNIIIDNFEVKEFEHEKYIVLDYFILDLKNKVIKTYDDGLEDSFIDGIKDIEKVSVNKIRETGNKQIEIITNSKNKIINELDSTNRIIGYKNNEVEEIGDYFLGYNKTLKELELNNVKKIKHCFLQENNVIEFLDLPKVYEIGDSFLGENETLNRINAPKLITIGDYFLFKNINLKQLTFDNLIQIGDGFLYSNKELMNLNLQNINIIGDDFLYSNLKLQIANFPKLITVGQAFLFNNGKLIYLNIPSIKKAEDYFLYNHLIYNRYFTNKETDSCLYNSPLKNINESSSEITNSINEVINSIGGTYKK